MHFCPSVAQQRRSEPAVAAAAAAQAQEAQTFETPIVCRLSGEKTYTTKKVNYGNHGKSELAFW